MMLTVETLVAVDRPTAGSGREDVALQQVQPPKAAHFGDRTRVVTIDVLVISGAVLASVLIRFSDEVPQLTVAVAQFQYWTVAAAMALAWIGALAIAGVWDRRILGRGVEEFRRLSRASLFLFGGIGVLAYLTKSDLARGFIAVALPMGLLALLVSHVAWRRWLVRQRRLGRNLTNVLVVGEPHSARYLFAKLQASPLSGYRPAGLCLVDFDSDAADPDHGIDDIVSAADDLGARVIAVASCDLIGPTQVRRLAWLLEGTGIRLVLAPSLVDVAGPRIHTTQVAGLPLMQVEAPRFAGPKLVVKAGFDAVAAAVGLLLLAPLMVAIVVAIRMVDGGPVFFRQERVGLDGRTFSMWKFRSMRVDAEALLCELQSQSHGNGVLFKMKNDPRVTRTGRFLRRFSLDELPQLWNVIFGQMSLVGPRPPLASEVELYGADVHRRFLVKPGVTGLWQVSGRSDLSWDESVRLDLYYVENWSLIGDVIILAKTFSAVVGKSGAY